MNRLRRPLDRDLEPPLDEVALNRIWEQIERRRLPAVRRHRALGLGFAGAALVAVLALAVVVMRSEPPASASAGPLQLEDGRLPIRFEASLSGRLRDGSEVAAAADTEVHVTENDGRRFGLDLARGSTDVHVEPGGNREWVVRCAPIAVVVRGTSFRVECRDDRVRVHVREGRVRVEGGVLGKIGVAVGRGETLEIPRHPETIVGREEEEEEEAPGTPTPRTEPIPEPIPEAPSEPTPRAVRGERSAPIPGRARAPAPPTPPEAPTPSGLMTAADSARREGRVAEAAGLLLQVAEAHPRAPEAPLAAFSAGRLLADRLHRPGDAASAFERAIALGLPRSLDEEARARLIESELRAGNTSAARAAASALEARYPESHHLLRIDRWLRHGVDP